MSRRCVRRNCYWNCGKNFRRSKSFWRKNCCRSKSFWKRNFRWNRNFWRKSCCQSKNFLTVSCCRNRNYAKVYYRMNDCCWSWKALRWGRRNANCLSSCFLWRMRRKKSPVGMCCWEWLCFSKEWNCSVEVCWKDW